MRIGIVGRGRWGSVYARTLEKLGIEYEWGYGGDGVIVATPAETHYAIAKRLLLAGTPIILEKPVTLEPEQARELVTLGGIAFAGHTRTYAPSWRKFRASLENPKDVVAIMGRDVPDPWMDCGPHLVAMCLDIGVDPVGAVICTPQMRVPLSFTVGERTWHDNPYESPLEVLITEFVEAIRLGKPNNAGLRLGAEVVEFLWRYRRIPT